MDLEYFLRSLAREYIINRGNAYQAAIKAGYTIRTAKHAYQWIDDTKTKQTTRRLPYKPYSLPEPMTCDPQDLSGGISLEIMEKYLRIHESRRRRCDYLENLYKGFHDVYKEPEKEEWKPDNRLAVNFPRYITETFTGYAGCCEICAAMNGKVFKVKKMVVGDNAPPLHPNCRCGTVPHMDMDEYEEWLDGYKDHGLRFDEWKKQVAYVSHHTVNYAKAIDNISTNDNFGKIGFTKEELLEEAQKSAAGRQVIKALRNSEFRAVITSQIDLFDPYARGSSHEDENVVYLHVPNIKSKVVAAQTLIHEYIHIHYHIGGCQHAEAICFAYEKMHIMNRDYLYEDEWNYVKKLAVDNYNGHWEKGGYGNYEQFDFVRRRKEK